MENDPIEDAEHGSLWDHVNDLHREISNLGQQLLDTMKENAALKEELRWYKRPRTSEEILERELPKFKEAMNDPRSRAEVIKNGKTKRGGYTKAFLESIGIQWPPKRGWKQRYIKHGNMEGIVKPHE